MPLDIEQEKRWQAELEESRLCYQTEMRRALRCKDAREKKALVEEWRTLYSPLRVEGLLKCAKDVKSCKIVANWDVERFDKHRKTL